MHERLVYLPERDLLITEAEWYRRAQALLMRMEFEKKLNASPLLGDLPEPTTFPSKERLFNLGNVTTGGK